jgi:putative peptidoglycan lipid II flippase
LNVLGHFAAPALAPVGLNAAMIIAVLSASLWVADQSSQVLWLAVGVVIGGAVQLGMQVPFLIRYKVYFWRSARIWHPGLKRILVLMGPVLFGAAVYQINSLVITLLASLLPQGSISYLYYADRLVQFPLGIFGIAAATAVLPTLARQATEQNWEALQETFGYAMRFVFFITLPCMAGLIVLREPIVALLFQRGAFNAQTTRLTASALLYYTMGLWAFSAVRIVLTAFYALKDTRTPVCMAVLSIAANIVLGIVLMGPMQHNGLALALSLASVINFGLLTVALRKKLGSLGWRSMVTSINKSLGCAFCMGLVVWGLAHWIFLPDQSLPRLHLLIGLIVCILTGIAVFSGLAYVFKLSELQTVLQMIAERKQQA